MPCRRASALSVPQNGPANPPPTVMALYFTVKRDVPKKIGLYQPFLKKTPLQKSSIYTLALPNTALISSL
jgi:hypothetical protein